jgi:hypothetical protein
MGAARANWTRSLITAAGLLLLTVLIVEIGPAQIAGLLARLGAQFLVIAAMFAGHECLRASILSRCIRPEERPSYRDLLRVRLFGEAAGTLTRTGPFAAEPTRVVVLANQALRTAHAVGAAASELIANTLASAFVTIAVVVYGLWTHHLHGAISALAQTLLWGSIGYVAVVGIALISRVYVIGAIVRWAGALPLFGRRLRGDPEAVRRMEDSVFHALADRPKAALQIVLLELGAQAILVTEIFWTIRSMGVPVTFRSALLVEVLIKAPNMIQFAGATEGGYALIFIWLGMTPAVGLTLSLVRLLRSLVVCGVGVGLFARSAPRAGNGNLAKV